MHPSHPTCAHEPKPAAAPAQRLVDAVEAAASAMSHAAEMDALNLVELNAQSDRFVEALKDVHVALRGEILRLGDREQHTNERTVYSSREALQLTGMRAAVVHTHVDAMLAALPDDGRDAVAKPEG